MSLIILNEAFHYAMVEESGFQIVNIYDPPKHLQMLAVKSIVRDQQFDLPLPPNIVDKDALKCYNENKKFYEVIK